MTPRTYKGSDVREVLARVKADLGPDAVIHNTRWERTPGLFGLFAGETVEITASRGGADAQSPSRQPSKRPAGGLAERRYRETARLIGDERPADARTREPRGVETELARLRAVIEEMRAGLDEVRTLLFSALVRQGFPDADASRLADAAARGVSSGERVSSERAMSRLLGILRGALRIRTGLQPGAHRPKYCALVGPTGSGKTTTIAKLAAISALKRSLSVGLVSIDDYRVGGGEQIRRYAEIIGLPLFHAAAAQDAAAVRGALSDRDLVLVDTTGRSPGDALALSETARILRELAPDEIFLAVEAGILGEYAERIRMSFGRCFRISGVIITKVDEIPCVGGAVSLAVALSAPLAYITNGQRVPDDIRSASADAVMRLLSAPLDGLAVPQRG